MTYQIRKLTGATAALVVLASPALAHHPLGGLPMTTFGDGVLSGVGHPLLGFDHLLFVALVGVAAVFTGRALAAPAGYILAMLAGCLLTSFGFALPLQEVVIGLSLLVLGGIVLSGRALSTTSALIVFAAFGLFHGAAFGGSIVQQEAGVGAAVLVGYLIGLSVVQYLIAIAAGWAIARIWQAKSATSMSARIAGALVAGAGVLLTLENAEGAAFAALGWGA